MSMDIKNRRRTTNDCMKLLNSKTVTECENEEEHNRETKEILCGLLSYHNFDCAIIFKYFDIVNKYKEPIIKSSKLHDCVDMIKFADIKNGVDIAVVDGFLTLICYGANYIYNEEYYMVVTGIQIRPYDENRDFIYYDDMTL